MDDKIKSIVKELLDSIDDKSLIERSKEEIKILLKEFTPSGLTLLENLNAKDILHIKNAYSNINVPLKVQKATNTFVLVDAKLPKILDFELDEENYPELPSEFWKNEEFIMCCLKNDHHI